MDQRADYAAAWRDLRVRRNVSLACFALAITLIAAGLLTSSNRMFRRVVQLPCMAVAGMAIVWYVTFHCPRCHKPFFYKGPARSLAGNYCMHCGLPRNAPYDPDHPPA